MFNKVQLGLTYSHPYQLYFINVIILYKKVNGKKEAWLDLFKKEGMWLDQKQGLYIVCIGLTSKEMALFGLCSAISTYLSGMLVKYTHKGLIQSLAFFSPIFIFCL